MFHRRLLSVVMMTTLFLTIACGPDHAEECVYDEECGACSLCLFGVCEVQRNKLNVCGKCGDDALCDVDAGFVDVAHVDAGSRDTRGTDTRSTDIRSTDTRYADARADSGVADVRRVDVSGTDNRGTDTQGTDTQGTDLVISDAGPAADTQQIRCEVKSDCTAATGSSYYDCDNNVCMCSIAGLILFCGMTGGQANPFTCTCSTSTSDPCVDNNWYGDGECDTFCPNYDSDCDGMIGAPCASNNDCDAPLFCNTASAGWPGGYCSVSCLQDSDCPAYDSGQSYGNRFWCDSNTRLCLTSCNNHGYCRDGYVCADGDVNPTSDDESVCVVD